MTGVSYSADMAIGSLALRNPHITAAAPISYDFDPYEDIMRPGGILIQPLIAPYGLLLQILDKAHGTTCATSAATRQLCQAARADRCRCPSRSAGRTAQRCAPPRGPSTSTTPTCPPWPRPGSTATGPTGPQSWTVASVGSKTAAIAASGVPILTFAGWLDAGTANGVLSEFASLPNTQESWIGPWSHGQGYFADPFQPSRQLTAAEHQQLNDRVYAFFDRYVKHDARPDGTRRAALLHPKRGHLAHHHPLAGRRHPDAAALLRRRAHADLAARRRPAGLEPAAPQPDRGHRVTKDRWNTNLTGDPVVYPNRAAVDRKLLTYTTAPLRRPPPSLALAGSPST